MLSFFFRIFFIFNICFFLSGNYGLPIKRVAYRTAQFVKKERYSLLLLPLFFFFSTQFFRKKEVKNQSFFSLNKHRKESFILKKSNSNSIFNLDLQKEKKELLKDEEKTKKIAKQDKLTGIKLKKKVDFLKEYMLEKQLITISDESFKYHVDTEEKYQELLKIREDIIIYSHSFADVETQEKYRGELNFLNHILNYNIDEEYNKILREKEEVDRLKKQTEELARQELYKQELLEKDHLREKIFEKEIQPVLDLFDKFDKERSLDLLQIGYEVIHNISLISCQKYEEKFKEYQDSLIKYKVEMDEYINEHICLLSEKYETREKELITVFYERFFDNLHEELVVKKEDGYYSDYSIDFFYLEDLVKIEKNREFFALKKKELKEKEEKKIQDIYCLLLKDKFNNQNLYSSVELRENQPLYNKFYLLPVKFENNKAIFKEKLNEIKAIFEKEDRERFEQKKKEARKKIYSIILSLDQEINSLKEEKSDGFNEDALKIIEENYKRFDQYIFVQEMSDYLNEELKKIKNKYNLLKS